MKLQQGKFPKELMKKIITSAKTTLNPNVIVGPELGFDSAIVELKCRKLVVTTDPAILIPKELPIEAFAFGAIHFALSDLVVFGGMPEYMLYNIIFPVGYDADKAINIIQLIAEEAKNVGLSIIGGHTAAYHGINVPLASTTIIGELIADVNPKNISANDVLIVTDKIGLEFAVAYAYKNYQYVEKLLGSKVANKLRDLWKEETVYREALMLIKNVPIKAMHDVTEGGLIGALLEWNESIRLGITIDLDKIPIRDYVKLLLDDLKINPLNVSSSGALIIAVDSNYANDVITTLEKIGVKSNVIGRFTSEGAVKVFKGGREITNLEIKDAYSEYFK